MNEPHKSTDPGTWQPRFTVGLLLLVTFVFSVMGAAGYYFVQSIEGGDFRLGFILFTVASPLLLLVVVSCARAVFEWSQRRR